MIRRAEKVPRLDGRRDKAGQRPLTGFVCDRDAAWGTAYFNA